MEKMHEPEDFESDFRLEQLLSKNSQSKISMGLGRLEIADFQLVDCEGQCLLQNGTPRDCVKVPLVIELEPIGYLLVDEKNKKLASAASAFINEILQTNWRYLMASSLHLEVTKSDFEALKEKNRELVKSKEKYKQLSEHLEERVQQQVKIIEDSQRQLYETEKQASVGQLAAGIAHEINNPIGFIYSNLNTASEYLQELKQDFEILLKNNPSELDAEDLNFVLSDFTELLSESTNGAKRVANIVADLRSFSNVQQAEERTLDLNESIQLVSRIFKTSVNAQVEIQIQMEPLPKLNCKPAHINQLLLNLLQNAYEAINQDGEIIEGGKITLSSQRMTENVEISVSDNGRGMSQEVIKNVFTPFYTTREVGSGTGLGLTVCRDIVKAHHGEIDIESEVGSGTRVCFRIPIEYFSGDIKSPLTQ